MAFLHIELQFISWSFDLLTLALVLGAIQKKVNPLPPDSLPDLLKTANLSQKSPLLQSQQLQFLHLHLSVPNQLPYLCVQPHGPELPSNFAEESGTIKSLGLETILCLFLLMQRDITEAQNKGEPPQTQCG